MLGPELVNLFVGILFFIGVGVVVFLHKRANRPGGAAQGKQEALFQATFPELQPYFHPENVLKYVNARHTRGAKPGAFGWKNPPGFSGVPNAEIAPGEKGEQVRLLDAAGATLAQFVYQDNPDGGVIRMGAGKLTVNVRDAAVRYWHPRREFKWSRLKGWRMISSLSDREIESSDRGTSFSSDSSSSSTATTAAAAGAAAAVVAGAGGAFDGGGSSAGWDSASGESRTSY